MGAQQERELRCLKRQSSPQEQGLFMCWMGLQPPARGGGDATLSVDRSYSDSPRCTSEADALFLFYLTTKSGFTTPYSKVIPPPSPQFETQVFEDNCSVRAHCKILIRSGICLTSDC